MKNMVDIKLKRQISIAISNGFRDIKNVTQWWTWPWYNLQTNVKVIHFGTYRFLVYDFL